MNAKSTFRPENDGSRPRMHGIRGALSRWVYHATEALTMEMPVTRVLAIVPDAADVGTG
jgi:hypothetical protein